MPVRAARLQTTADQLRRCESKVAELKDALERSRAGSQQWKDKADDAEQRVSAARQDAAQHAKQVEQLQAHVAKADRELDQLRQRVAELTDKCTRQAAELKGVLADTERDLGHAREHLMVIDTKLDILEGAANALDARTRTILSAKAHDPEVSS